MKKTIVLVVLLAWGSCGCQSKPEPKPTLSRGWIGGEYKMAKRKLVPKNQTSRVLVKQVYAGTPAEQAGLQLGDLVVAIGHSPVTTLKEFRRGIDAISPGTSTTLLVYRDGQEVELPLIIGRETYQEWHSVQMGLGFSSALDLWPNPDFSVLPVAQYKRPAKRVELRSGEMILAQQARPQLSGADAGVSSEEGWRAWFLIFGMDAHKRILSQEPLEAPPAQP